jgi:hypothetical protein
MHKRIIPFTILVLCLFTLRPAFGQSTKGIINGAVKDAQGAVLQGAKVDFQPQLRPVTTDELGDFAMTEVNPGTYVVTITYVGFAPYSGTVYV